MSSISASYSTESERERDSKTFHGNNAGSVYSAARIVSQQWNYQSYEEIMRFGSVSGFSLKKASGSLRFCTCAEQSFHPPNFANAVNKANYIQLKPGGCLDGFHGNEKQMAARKVLLLVSYKMSSTEYGQSVSQSVRHTLVSVEGGRCVFSELQPH